MYERIYYFKWSRYVDKKPYVLCTDEYFEKQKEPCEDAISRQAVIDALYDMEKIKYRIDLENVIKALPSVNPEKLIGHWIHTDELLDKIRTEIEDDWQLEIYPNSPFSCGLRRAIDIIDKYKTERREE